jgi:S1-C subfamily serine protease
VLALGLAAGCAGGEENATDTTTMASTSATATTGTTVTEASTQQETAPTPIVNTLPRLVKQVRSGIVRVEVDTCDGSGVGTGFLVSPRHVVTVEHVVESAARIRLKRGGNPVRGKVTVIGIDRDRDLALLRLEKPASSAYVFRFADVPPQIGDEVVALGFPLGLPLTLSRGTVSGLNRTIPIKGVRRRALVQTDAAVSPGNSGGPLMRIDSGDVVGLLDLKDMRGEGVAFAVSAKVAAPLVEAWRAAPQTHPLEHCANPLPPLSGRDRQQPIPPGPPTVGVPARYEGHFTSVDRLQRCYAQAGVVWCTSGPSRQRVKLVAGRGAYDQGTPGSKDVGGPSMPMGTSFTTSTGEISCESSTRGISCRDGAGHGFTIGDHSFYLDAAPRSSGGGSVGVPAIYDGAFTSVDRLQRCFATDDVVGCSSGPSGQGVSLVAGLGASYEGITGSADNGGPSMPMGTQFTTPGGNLRCDSSSRGITCRDAATGSGFTIGDHYVVVRNGGTERRY